MPNLKLIANDSISVLHEFDRISSLEVKHALREPSTFKLVVPTNTPKYAELTKGRFIGLSLTGGINFDRLFKIEQLERTVSGDSVSITGRDYSGIFYKRAILPPAGQAYQSYTSINGEQVAKDLVYLNVGLGASVPRRLPNFSIESNSARGPVITLQARYQSLASMLKEVVTFCGSGFEVVWTGLAGQEHQFRSIYGTDRTASVFFDLEFETVSDQSWLQSDMDRITMLYGLGQGEGVNRTVVERHPGGVEQSGLNRLEGVADMRDLSAVAAIQERADSILAASQTDSRHSASVSQFGSFRYGTHFTIGDVVSIQNRVWGLYVPARIVFANFHWDASSDEPTVEVELDKPWPTIKDRISQEAYGTSVIPASGAVDYHSENHASRHAPAGADPLPAEATPFVPLAGGTMTGPLVAPNVFWGLSGLRTESFTDFNQVLPSGFYDGINLANAPLGISARWYLLHIRHGNPANNYAAQMTWQQSDLGMVFTRNIENGVGKAWERVWHSGNDGTGSGLNADVVRGYVPVNRSGDVGVGSITSYSDVGAVTNGGYQGTQIYSSGSMDMRSDQPYFFWRSQPQDQTCQMILQSGGIVFYSYTYGVAAKVGAVVRLSMNSPYAMWMEDTGYVGFGTPSASWRIQTPNSAGSPGGVLANSFPTYSSEQDKVNIVPIPDDDGEQLSKIIGVTYNPKDAPEMKKAGFVAEQVAEVFPEAAVYYDEWQNREQATDPETGEPMVDPDTGLPVWVEGTGELVKKAALDYQAIIPLIVQQLKFFRRAWADKNVVLQAAQDDIQAAFLADRERLNTLEDAVLGLKRDTEKAVQNLHNRTRVLEQRSTPPIPNAPLPVFEVLFT